MWTGRPLYSKAGADGPRFPWKYRLGLLRYLILGGVILNTLGYERSYLLGTAPTGLPPFAGMMWNLYKFAVTDDDTKWGKWQKEKAGSEFWRNAQTFIPGYLSGRDLWALYTGRKDLSQFLLYRKGKTMFEKMSIDELMKYVRDNTYQKDQENRNLSIFTWRPHKNKKEKVTKARKELRKR